MRLAVVELATVERCMKKSFFCIFFWKQGTRRVQRRFPRDCVICFGSPEFWSSRHPWSNNWFLWFIPTEKYQRSKNCGHTQAKDISVRSLQYIVLSGHAFPPVKNYFHTAWYGLTFHETYRELRVLHFWEINRAPYYGARHGSILNRTTVSYT